MRQIWPVSLAYCGSSPTGAGRPDVGKAVRRAMSSFVAERYAG